MDGISAFETIVSLVQLAWQVTQYIKEVKGAEGERQKLILELIRARGLLIIVKDLADGVGKDTWAEAITHLLSQNGPLDAFKGLLEDIMDELGLEKISKEAPKTQQAAPGFLKSRLSKLVSYFQEDSSSGSSTNATRKRSEAFEPPPNDYQWTITVKLKSTIKDLKWPFTQPEVEALINRLEPIKTHFLVALSSDNVRLSKLIYGDTRAIIEHQEGSKPWTQEQKLVFKSISTLKLPPHATAEQLEKLRQGASWLLHHSTFHDWLDSGSTLLLIGIPGSGKTSICEVLENYLQGSDDAYGNLVIPIYFSFRDPLRFKNMQAMLALIVEHMLKVRPQTQKYYNNLMLTGEGPLEVDDCLRIIHRARQDFQNVYILIDALDECDPELAREVVARLTGLRSPLRVFATSRPGPLEKYFHYRIEISAEAALSDMKTYVQTALAEELPFYSRLDPGQVAEITEMIIAQSAGVYVMKPSGSFSDSLLIPHRFLYAKLLIRELSRARSTGETFDMLEMSARIKANPMSAILESLNKSEEGRQARICLEEPKETRGSPEHAREENNPLKIKRRF